MPDVKFGIDRLSNLWPERFSMGSLRDLTHTVAAAWKLYPSQARITEDLCKQCVNMTELAGDLHGTVLRDSAGGYSGDRCNRPHAARARQQRKIGDTQRTPAAPLTMGGAGLVVVIVVVVRHDSSRSIAPRRGGCHNAETTGRSCSEQRFRRARTCWAATGKFSRRSGKEP